MYVCVCLSVYVTEECGHDNQRHMAYISCVDLDGLMYVCVYVISFLAI